MSIKPKPLTIGGYFAMSPDGETVLGWGKTAAEALEAARFLVPHERFYRERASIEYKPCSPEVLEKRPRIAFQREGIYCTPSEAADYDYLQLQAEAKA